MYSAELMQDLVEATIASSAALLVVLLLRNAMRASFGASTAYLSWSIVPVGALAILLPATPADATQPMLVLMQSVAPVNTIRTVAARGTDFSQWLAVTWLLGTVAMAVRLIVQQHAFTRGLGPLLVREDGLHQSQSIAGLPAAIGLFRPLVVVPSDFDQRYSSDEQQLLRKHEYAHIRHGDLQCNALASFLRCIFWFNPLLHYAARHFRQDQELACDQRVISRHPQPDAVMGKRCSRPSSRRNHCRSAATGVSAIHSRRESQCSRRLFPPRNAGWPALCACLHWSLPAAMPLGRRNRLPSQQTSRRTASG